MVKLGAPTALAEDSIFKLPAIDNYEGPRFFSELPICRLDMLSFELLTGVGVAWMFSSSFAWGELAENALFIYFCWMAE